MLYYCLQCQSLYSEYWSTLILWIICKFLPDCMLSHLIIQGYSQYTWFEIYCLGLDIWNVKVLMRVKGISVCCRKDEEMKLKLVFLRLFYQVGGRQIQNVLNSHWHRNWLALINFKPVFLITPLIGSGSSRSFCVFFWLFFYIYGEKVLFCKV